VFCSTRVVTFSGQTFSDRTFVYLESADVVDESWIRIETPWICIENHGSALIGQSLVMASPGITGIRQVKKTWIRLVSKQVSRVYHDAFGGKEAPIQPERARRWITKNRHFQ